MRHYEIIGFVVEGDFYCPEHATCKFTPVFAGNEGHDDDVCTECFNEWFSTADPKYNGVGYIPNYVYLVERT